MVLFVALAADAGVPIRVGSAAEERIIGEGGRDRAYLESVHDAILPDCLQPEVSLSLA